MKCYGLFGVLLVFGVSDPALSLTNEERNTIQVCASVSQSMVLILSRGVETRGDDRVREIWTSGSGIAIKPGLVLTNFHVLEQAWSLEVVLQDGRRVDATLIGTAPGLDLALLRVPVSSDTLPPARLAATHNMKVGQKVLAIGSPFGLDHSVTSGIVSGLDREVLGLELGPSFIQFDAPVNPGQSGGALVDSDGQVVGLITAKVSGGESVGFALPIDIAVRAIPDLERMGHAFRPQLGFGGIEVTADLAALFDLPVKTGILVQEIDEGGAAHKAGLKLGQRHIYLNDRDYILDGDIIVAVDGLPTRKPMDLLLRLLSTRPGETLGLEVVSSTGPRHVEVIIPPMEH